LIRGDLDKLCDAYVSGEILVEGAVPDILACGMAIAEAMPRIPRLSRRMKLREFLPRKHSKEQDAADIRFHYDVSNDFYRLWLDRNMVYSCAYFRNGGETLDVAQDQKLDHICRKLQLQPGDRFLDIGCGWGGLVCWAAKKYDVRAAGATLSVNQRDHAVKFVAREGVAGKAEIQLRDYRDIAGEACFDRIASVGMYEHVGLGNLQLYFDRMAQLLRPGGTLLNHGIYLPNAQARWRGPATDFIGRYVFPGGELPTLAAVIRCVTQAGLEIADFEDLRPHYARTLSLWLSRLEARKHEAIAIAGPERYRIWRLFLGGMAFAFDAGWLSVGQIVAYKPAKHSAFRPWTREYQYSASRPAALAGRLTWHEAEKCDAAHA
jgi:cyclopropane-fatty-acyl-phospholipid synthase